LTEITGDDVAKLVAWRRALKTRHGKPPSPFTVNDTTEQLKKLFTRAKAWGIRFDHEPKWRDHWLKEPKERIRELINDEGARLDAATRDDWKPFFAFARTSGLRLSECVSLKWSEVDWEARQIRKPGKGDRMNTVPITTALRAILWPLRGHHPEMVFTYIGKDSHRRFPVTFNGAKTEWRRLRKRAGVVGFRFHDFRHDFGTKLLRATGNLKLVQKAMNHADSRTTLRYAHVLDVEVADALEQLQNRDNNPQINPQSGRPKVA
jgi:integrase